MKPYSTKINIRDSIIYTYWEFTQGDINAYPLSISIYDNQIPFDLTGCTVTITFKRANDTIVIVSADKVEIESNVVSYLVESSVYAVPGTLLATVEIYKGDARLTTCQLTASVRAQLSDGTEIPGQNEYPILVTLINEVNGLITMGDIDGGEF